MTRFPKNLKSSGRTPKSLGARIQKQFGTFKPFSTGFAKAQGKEKKSERTKNEEDSLEGTGAPGMIRSEGRRKAKQISPVRV